MHRRWCESIRLCLQIPFDLFSLASGANYKSSCTSISMRVAVERLLVSGSSSRNNGARPGWPADCQAVTTTVTVTALPCDKWFPSKRAVGQVLVEADFERKNVHVYFNGKKLHPGRSLSHYQIKDAGSHIEIRMFAWRYSNIIFVLTPNTFWHHGDGSIFQNDI
jgi:hypothetical protein